LDIDAVKNIAHLARIDVSEKDLETYTKDLSNILDMVDQMNAVDVTGAEPLSNALDATQRLRADVVTETDKREALQANAPATEDGVFLVPRVIE
jgi:aspartyl-tRNA(Asn)/glutamyl-tRNA(Gln) amidotransferase subunit C